MRRASLALALMWTLALLSGCGTLANLGGKGWQNTKIYGGVLRDVKSTEDWIADNPFSPKLEDITKDVGIVVGVGLVGIDFPLSAIADTLTLPITIPVAIWATPTANAPAASVSGKNAANPPNAKNPPPQPAVAPQGSPANYPAVNADGSPARPPLPGG